MLDDRDIPTGLGRLRVRVGGEGPAMLFWPSLLMDGSMWAGQVDQFAADHRVIVVDPPGHGASEPLRRRFTFAECADSVRDILDELEVDRVHLVGNSWGGMIGGTFAAVHPDRLRSAVLMGCTASPAGRLQRARYAVLTQAARLRGGIRPPFVRPAVRAFLGPTSLRTRPQVVTAVTEAFTRLDTASAILAVESVVPRRPDQRELLATVRAPVLVIAGREDITFPVAEVREMADAIPGARFVVLENTAHLIALEDPDAVNPLIADFVANH